MSRSRSTPRPARTVWETRYDAPFVETCSERLGPVPRAAPLIAGDRLITMSAGGLMNSFDRHTGTAAVAASTSWRRPADAVRACGYSASPLAFEDLIITTGRRARPRRGRGDGGVGRDRVAVAGLSERLLVAAPDRSRRPAGGRRVHLRRGRPGSTRETGALEWTVPHASDQGVNVATPVWGGDNLLFVSSAYNGGSRVLRLSRADRTAHRPSEARSRSKRSGRTGACASTSATPSATASAVYASNGDFGAAPFAAIDVGDRRHRSGATAASRDRRSSASPADGMLLCCSTRTARSPSPRRATPG